MRKHVESAMPKSLVRVVSVCALAAGLGACSEATRFTEAPFANPFKTAQAPAVRDPVTTGSIGRSPSYQSQPVYQGAAPSAGVSSQPLAPPSAPVAMNSAPVPAAPSSSRGAGGWVAEGGTSVVVAHGETLDVISNRYGVPRTALMSVNGLSGNTVAPGTRLTVPVYNANAAAVASRAATSVQQPVAAARQEASRLAPVAAAPAGTLRAPAPAAAAASAAKARADAAQAEKARVAADTRSMTESRARFAAEAKAKAEARAAGRAGQSTKVAALPPAEQPQAAAPARTQEARPAPQPSRQAAPEPKAAEQPRAEPQTTASLPKAEPASANADFRWPARGRVIAGFNGRGGNEGINIAVPEGTPVKAAEGGVVAYAGSELKGYGNLVLIRHPNGYVSAYAHNGELSVKRGDAVKRGQVVARSGQSGNVTSPQLHFELRKGSNPVDPMPYLNN